jgi:hypothetical protein
MNPDIHLCIGCGKMKLGGVADAIWQEAPKCFKAKPGTSFINEYCPACKPEHANPVGRACRLIDELLEAAKKYEPVRTTERGWDWRSKLVRRELEELNHRAQS